MATLKTTLFEAPLYLYITLAVAELVLAAVWYERRARKWAALLAVPVVLAGVVFAVEAAVATDREQIIGAAKEIARDLEQGRTDAAEKYLDDEFRGPWATKRRAVTAAKSAMERYRIKNIRLRNLEVDVAGDTARMRVSTIISFGGSSEAGGMAAVRWNVHWIRRPDGWHVIEVERPRQGVAF